jgi:glycosyltransferase involved in cell wall biosynthesis
MNAPTQRLAVVVSHPIQYYAPWFRWMTARGWTLRVFYLWDAGVAGHRDREFGRTIVWDVDLLSGYEAEFVPNIAIEPGTHHLRGLNNPELGARLRAWQPDAILLFGYNYLTHLRLLLAPPAPLIFRGDSHLLGQSKRGLIKCAALTLLYARISAIIHVGLANYDYFRAFGVRDEKLFHAPHCVDADHFVATPETQAAAESLRTKLGLDGKRVLLFAGKLIRIKRPLELLNAFHSLAPVDTALVFVGEGSELPALQHLAALHPDLCVRFLPFANQSEMPSRYLLADVFALPTGGPGETWGLAVNEAMHAGVPCLVSDRVGCQRDLVTEGDTGWVFSADAPGGLEAALQRALLATAQDAAGFHQRVVDRIAGYTYATATAGLAQAVQSLGPRRVV